MNVSQGGNPYGTGRFGHAGMISRQVNGRGDPHHTPNLWDRLIMKLPSAESGMALAPTQSLSRDPLPAVLS